MGFPSSIADLTSHFDSFVQESLPEVAHVEAQLLNDFFEPRVTPVVIYGFGDIGRRLLAGFARLGVTPSAISWLFTFTTARTISGRFRCSF